MLRVDAKNVPNKDNESIKIKRKNLDLMKSFLVIHINRPTKKVKSTKNSLPKIIGRAIPPNDTAQ